MAAGGGGAGAAPAGAETARAAATASGPACGARPLASKGSGAARSAPLPSFPSFLPSPAGWASPAPAAPPRPGPALPPPAARGARRGRAGPCSSPGAAPAPRRSPGPPLSPAPLGPAPGGRARSRSGAAPAARYKCEPRSPVPREQLARFTQRQAPRSLRVEPREYSLRAGTKRCCPCFSGTSRLLAFICRFPSLHCPQTVVRLGTRSNTKGLRTTGSSVAESLLFPNQF